MTAKQEIYYPPGVTPKDELDNEKETPQKSTVRYPSKAFYATFYAICKKAKVSVNAVLVGAAAEFSRRNEFLLKKK